MAGLLSGEYLPDPLSQGLLGLGSALLTPRAMGGGIGPGMQAFAQQAQQAQMMRRQMAQDAMRERLTAAQVKKFEMDAAEDQRKADLQKQLQTAAQAAYTKPVPDTWEGPGTPGGLDIGKLFEGISQVAPLEALKLRKDLMGDTKPVAVGGALVDPSTGRVIYEGDNNKLQSVAPGGSLVDRSGRVVFQAPNKEATPTEIEKLVAARNALPQGSPDWKAINDRIDALNYRQPPASMNVSYGAPFTGVDPSTGLPMLYQPSNRGGAPIATGLAPPPEKGKDLPEGAAKQVAGTRNLRDAISAYQSELQNWDRFSVVSPAKVAKMDTLYNNMMLQAKEAYNLGVLNGPDYEIMTRVVTPPASFKGMMYGSKALSDQANTLSGIATSIEKQVVAAHPGARPTTAAANGVAGASGFSMLPPAKDYSGKTARDTQSGKRYRSDGTKWVEVPQ